MVFSTQSSRPYSVVEKLWHVHWPVLIVVSLIAAIGTATLYSVAGGTFQPWAERHAMRFLVGLAAVIAIALVRPEIWMKLAYPAFLVSVIMLLAVPFVGIEALGARRWIGIGSLTFQPSEMIKLALVPALARYYQWLPLERVSQPRWVLIPLMAIFIPVALTLKQPDLGSATLFAVVGLAIMFMAGVSAYYFLAGGITVMAALPLIWANLHDYQKKRVHIFLDPDRDPLGAGYHITQSKIALGSGGVSGKGFMQGTQSQLDFVPEKHTDFIGAMIGEEWGFAGLLVILVLYALLGAMLLGMAWRCRNRFGRLLIVGSAVTFFIYVFINLAMVMGLVPVVGVPLPLVSYGGTSMTTLMVGLGFAMSGYVHGEQVVRRDEMGTFL